MYSGSQTSSKDMNLLFPSSTFKNSSEGGEDHLQRNREVSMDANLFHRLQPNQQQNPQQFNSGLSRYRSAPSSLLEKLINGEDEGGCDNFIPPPTHTSHSEAESIFARFMSIAGGDSSDLREMNEKSAVGNRNNPPQFMEQETIEENNVFPPTSSQMMFQNPPISSPQPQQNSLQRQNSLNPAESSYRGVIDQISSPLKMGGGTNPTSNLIRHSSSPAGLFANLHVENGYAVMRGMGGTFRPGSGGDVNAGNSRLKSQMSFPSRPPTSSGLMSQISEIESEGGNSGEEGSMSNGNNRFIPGFPVASWDDGLENYTGGKRARDINNKMMNPSEAQSGEIGNHTTGLTHHFSLPKNSAEMAAILQYQDSVPCKIRAKRGCATHPRSIAERVRRTRISERMRKLQELVPNMDKQTNTADMLDLAVEYIKDLQTQVKTLNDNQVNCTCSNKQKL
ncbi:hypothetical protein MKW94_003564 [Papaver nudicaule]|uniref:BHLH domain-containing protein n=1 Tax=Papaver nudicaule TaxID=74823 RepID=A0AA41RW28_PAPNU|nr:hypothetical protein [Papaver nudicaule]